MLLDGVFYVNAADDILRSWSLVVFGRETVPELAGLRTAVAGECQGSWCCISACRFSGFKKVN